MELEEITVTACAVEAMEDVDPFLVALADDPERQEQVLELQRALPGSELDEQGRGTDTYIVRSGTRRSSITTTCRPACCATAS